MIYQSPTNTRKVLKEESVSDRALDPSIKVNYINHASAHKICMLNADSHLGKNGMLVPQRTHMHATVVRSIALILAAPN